MAPLQQLHQKESSGPVSPLTWIQTLTWPWSCCVVLHRPFSSSLPVQIISFELTGMQFGACSHSALHKRLLLGDATKKLLQWK